MFFLDQPHLCVHSPLSDSFTPGAISQLYAVRPGLETGVKPLEFGKISDDTVCDVAPASTIRPLFFTSGIGSSASLIRKACSLFDASATSHALSQCFFRLHVALLCIALLQFLHHYLLRQVLAMWLAMWHAVVQPLLKKPGLDQLELSNYRPISKLRLLSKIVEKVVYLQLGSFLKENSITEIFQSGFKPGHMLRMAQVTLFILALSNLLFYCLLAI